MRVARSIGGEIAEIAGVMIDRVRPAMVRVRRIKMRAGRGCVRRRAIALLVNMKSVFARRQILDVSDDLHIAARLGERHRALHFAAGFRFQLRDRFGHILRLRQSD